MPHSDFARAARHAHSYLGYTLAEKRCTQFGTCGANGDSSDSADRPSYVNRQLLSLYNEGLTYLRADADDAVVNCGMAEATKDKIVAKVTIPLVQGTIAYAYKSDPAVGYYSAAADSEHGGSTQVKSYRVLSQRVSQLVLPCECVWFTGRVGVLKL